MRRDNDLKDRRGKNANDKVMSYIITGASVLVIIIILTVGFFIFDNFKSILDINLHTTLKKRSNQRFSIYKSLITVEWYFWIFHL